MSSHRRRGADPALVSRAEEARHRLIELVGDLTRRAHEARSIEAQIAKLSSTLRIDHAVAGITPAGAGYDGRVGGSAIEVEAVIPNRDVGFIRVGQEVAVKLETFIFTRYGLITGKVRVLSGDAVDDPKQGPVYPARITLDGTSLVVEGRETAVTPGMAATVEIKTGERRLIDYVLTPLLKTTQEAMRER
jgi:hemolysin D